MFYHEEIVLLVLCFIGYSLCITNNPIPNRRFYFYNPELISHAATALNMIVPQPLYKPLPPLQYSPHPLQVTHYNDLDDEEEEDSEEYEKHKPPPNLQLFTLIKPKKTKKKMKKNKGGIKKIKKFFKKCLPFKLRIIKKSDVFKNDPLYVNNYDSLHYAFDNQHLNGEDLALISLNTSGILENKPNQNIPQVLHFLYPRYNFRKQPQHKLIRKIPKPPNKQIIRSRRPWPKRTKWRLARPGRPVQNYPLKEPIPGTTGGSPPPSPLYNIYRDNRIPVNQNYLAEESSIKFTEDNLIDKTRSIEEERYSDPDYYRYGIYDQNQYNAPSEQYNKTAEADADLKYYYHSTFAMSPERVVTVTPTTSWVPIPQIAQMNKNIDQFQNNSSKINFKSGGFKSLNYGDKISKNCSKRFYNNRIESFRCLEQTSAPSNSSDAQFYIEEIPVKSQQDIKTKKKARSNEGDSISNNDDIVTAKYPEDDFNQIYISAKRSNSVRAGRSEMGLTAVVSGSLLLHEN